MTIHAPAPGTPVRSDAGTWSRRHPPRLRLGGRSVVTGYAFLGPSLLIYSAFLLWPLIQTVYLSLTDWNGLSERKPFVGLANYRELLADDVFWAALVRNFIWAGVGALGPMCIGLFLALLLWSNPPGFVLYRTVYFMPQVLAPVAVAIVFAWIYEPSFGILNRFLRSIGLDHLAVPWLAEPRVALFALIAVAIWVETGFAFVIFVAALQEVDRDLLDAASIDGAGVWGRLRYVTLPEIGNAINLVAVALLIAGFNAFDYVWIMTRGGPGGSTDLTSTYLYEVAFVDTRIGYGSAISTVATLVTITVSLLVLALRERNG